MDNPGRADLNLKLVKPTVPDCPRASQEGGENVQYLSTVLITLLQFSTKQIPESSSDIAQ